MMYYRCKCGDRESFGSMPPNPCAQCETCGSDLAPTPELHRPPRDHDWETRLVDTDEGQRELTVCRWCGLHKVDWIKMRANMLVAPKEADHAD